MKVYRMAQERHARSIEEMLSGEGAAKFGGRWNSAGTPAIYCSISVSLCALEILAHLPRGALKLYKILELEVPNKSIIELKQNPVAEIYQTQQAGDAMLGPNGVLAFSVASIVNPFENNIILNPSHPKFSLIKPGEIKPFPFDQRLANSQ